MTPIFDLQLDQGEAGPSGDVQSQEEMGVGEATAIHSKLSTAIRCEHLRGGQYMKLSALGGSNWPMM